MTLFLSFFLTFWYYWQCICELWLTNDSDSLTSGSHNFWLFDFLLLAHITSDSKTSDSLTFWLLTLWLLTLWILTFYLSTSLTFDFLILRLLLTSIWLSESLTSSPCLCHKKFNSAILNHFLVPALVPNVWAKFCEQQQFFESHIWEMWSDLN